MRTLADLPDLKSKRVIVRCDLNVPLDGSRITDDGRILASLPTLNHLLGLGAKVIVISHLGRPDGSPVSKYSLEPVASRLGELLDTTVSFSATTVGSEAQAAVENLQDGQVLVLENLRFNAGETAKEASERNLFAEQLAQLGEFFVSDGFGVVHRKQASVYELPGLLPSVAGFLIEKELEVLTRL
ncbi:MAG: hypothetical protein RJA75_228, partial [Actinomycetota bacterium]